MSTPSRKPEDEHRNEESEPPEHEQPDEAEERDIVDEASEESFPAKRPAFLDTHAYLTSRWTCEDSSSPPNDAAITSKPPPHHPQLMGVFDSGTATFRDPH